MHYHQFAHSQVSYPQAVKELQSLGFLTEIDLENTTPNSLWLNLVAMTFCQAKTPLAKQTYLANLLARPNQTLLEFAANNTLETEVFYAVALQLLGFEVGVDFEVAESLEFMETVGLKSHNQVQTVEELLLAWYDLLELPRKNGQSFLDYLATQGFFLPMYNLPAKKKPQFYNGKSLPIFDTSQLIYEVVYVESDLDTDHDGRRDLLQVQIIRPKDTEACLRVPAVFTASPYNRGTNPELGQKLTHNVDVPLIRKEPNQVSYQDIHAPHQLPSAPEGRLLNGHSKEATESFDHSFTYSLNNYLLARGFAVVYAAGIGTRGSEGLRTCGSVAETASTTAIIEWLNGKRPAFTDRTSNHAINAWWCNGAVAMTGKSYLGTLANAAATTGVEGLKTIIAEAAISSWYDYYRDGGLVVAPGGFPGEDADVLAGECLSRMKDAGDFLNVQSQAEQTLATIKVQQDRQSGNYNQFWDARNYLNDSVQVKCDVMLVHGLNDWNVKPRNVYNFYKALSKLPIATKLVLHQGQHIYINNFRSLDFNQMVNLWLSNHLYNCQNDAVATLPNVVVQDNVQAEKWHALEAWEADSNLEVFNFNPKHLTNTKSQGGQASFKDQLPPADFDHYKQDWTAWKTDLVKEESPLTHNRLLFATDILKEDLTLQGAPRLKLKIKSNRNVGMVSAMLVDLGKAKRLGEVPTVLDRQSLGLGYHWHTEDLVEFTLAQESDFKLISKGHRNLQNRTSLWQNDELEADTFYQVNFDLQPSFYTIPAGRKLGLIIYATDMEMTVRGNQDLTYTLQLENCQLQFLKHN
ncbi:Xaa-Pro dipeptidyl-peptidase [Ligilactobacillus equi]|uniref:Xaa-Pro dipeptidyl-peptidase n=1 Tax=Ligilactobacillus equi TaxID=137357 RepID=UPI002ED60135